MTHRLQAGADRLKSIQPQQIQGCRPQRGQRTGAVAPVAMGVLMELGLADPVPALNAPAVPHQTQQGFWGGAQAGVAPRGAPGEPLQVGGPEGLAIPAALGDHLDDPAGAAPGRADVLGGLFRPQCPRDRAAVADLVIRCHERDLAFPLELAADLAVQRLPVGSPLGGRLRLHRQQDVGPLLLEELKNGCCLCRASAWINTPSSSSSPSSCRSTARSWFSPVA